MPAPVPVLAPFPSLPQPPRATAAVSDDPADASVRAERYRIALADPFVQEILKRFEADVVARELGDVAVWLERLGGSGSR